MAEFLKKASAWLAALGLAAPATAHGESTLETLFEGAEETFEVFPTYAAPDEEGNLTVPVRAWVYEPEEDSVTRALLVKAMKSALGLDHPEKNERFEKRIGPFLVDNERGKTVEMQVGNERYPVGESAADGHMRRRIEVPAEVAEPAIDSSDGRRLLNVTFHADFGMKHSRRIPIVEREGLSVISDIDDTIKKTGVLDTEQMLKNTFFRHFEAVPGMAEMYQRMQATVPSMTFHYVSASPWQLLPFLASFTEFSGFPGGSYHLRQLRPKSIRSPANFVRGSEDHKTESIGEILGDFPKRRFILIGDSSEHDPEIYGTIARKHPDRVAHIVIRKVPGADNSEERFSKAFDGLNHHQWDAVGDPDDFDITALLQ